MQRIHALVSQQGAKWLLTLLALALIALIALAPTLGATVLFADNFESYSVNQRVPVNGNPWSTHSGGGDEPTIRSVSGSQWMEGGAGNGTSADINASISGGVRTSGSIYAGVDLRFISPTSGSGYFYHFREGFDLNTRVFASPSGNGVRLGLDGDGSSASVNWSAILNTNTTYRVVIRYNMSTGASALWVDPQTESSTNITANGGADPVGSIAFRQPSSGGTPTWQADNLIVADTFNEVLTTTSSGPTPSITSASPNSGSTTGGTNVTITGTNLTNVSSVTFGGMAGTSVSVTSATSLSVTTPAGSAGMVDIVVSDGTNSDTLTNGFTYVTPPPTIASVTPNSGPTSGGTPVTIAGSDLSNVTSVSFGQNDVLAANFTSQSATQIELNAPAGSNGMVDVSVSDGNQSDTLANAFTYTTLVPSITLVAPNSGPQSGGTTVTISGVNLSSVTSVEFGTSLGSNLNLISSTMLSVDTPPGSGVVDVSVSDGINSNTLVMAYTYTLPMPAITSIAPTSGPDTGGTRVTISGIDLSGVTSVMFGSNAGTGLSVLSATSIEIDSPAGSVGMVDLIISDGVNGDTLTNAFSYIAAMPSIGNISPTSGTVSGGTLVTISGSDLNGVTSVTFGGVAGTNLAISNANSLQVTTPAAAAPGLVDVEISDGTNGDTQLNGFQYQAATPIINSVLPASGTQSGGTVVTIQGIDLTNVSSVTFDGVAGTNLNVISATSLEVTTPAGTGLVDVVVSDGSASNTLTNGFSYLPPAPMLASISPASGTTAGGTLVTLTGVDLSGVISVSFGGSFGTSLSVTSATSLTVRTPSRVAGVVTVVVSDGSRFSSLVDAFTFVEPASNGGGFGSDTGSGGGGGCALTSEIETQTWLALAMLVLGGSLIWMRRRSS